MEELVRFITGFKKRVGGFSMVMYYDDNTFEDEAYVVRVMFANGQVEFFKASSFISALEKTFEYFMGIVENQE